MKEVKVTKQTYLEILRIISIFLVIFNHTRVHGYALYTVSGSPINYYGSLFFSVLCKLAVPCFFMISGVTLLSKEESLRDFYLKRVLRFVIIIIIFSLIQYLRIVRAQGIDFNLKSFLLLLYSGNVIEPYWYLKEYLAFLIIVPFLRVLVKNAPSEFFKYLLAIKVVGSVAAYILFYTGYGFNVSLPFATDIIFCPLVGYYLYKNGPLSIERRILLLICLLVACGANAALMKEEYLSTGGFDTFFQSEMSWLSAFILFAIFDGVRIKSKVIEKIVITAGSTVFGTYLLEDIVRNQLEFRLGFYEHLGEGLLQALLFAFLAMIIGMGITWVLKKIPVIRKLL